MRAHVLSAQVVRRATLTRAWTVGLDPSSAVEATASFTPRGITTEDTVVFVLGMVPFVWASYEFWRRIAVGEPFGTTTDSVIIRDTSGPSELPERRRVLGKGAIMTARALFLAVGLTLALVLIAGYQAIYNAN